MSHTRIFYVGLVGIVAVVCLLVAFVVRDVRATERALTAQAQRACVTRLSMVSTKADSLAILSGDSWKIGCAWILAADTTGGTR